MRVVVELVERTRVFPKALAGVRGPGGGAVKIDVFAFAKVGADADNVALVCDHVNQLGLPVDAADGRVA